MYSSHLSLYNKRCTSSLVDIYFRSCRRFSLFISLKLSVYHGALGRNLTERVFSGACSLISARRASLNKNWSVIDSAFDETRVDKDDSRSSLHFCLSIRLKSRYCKIVFAIVETSCTIRQIFSQKEFKNFWCHAEISKKQFMIIQQ